MSGRHSATVYCGRVLQRFPWRWLRPLESACLVRQKNWNLAPPIFLLALPRSGSTLSYQCLIHAFGPVYLSNLGNLLADLPYLGGWISDRRCGGRGMSFQSQLGFVPGLCGPAEGKRFWETWGGYGLSEGKSGRNAIQEGHEVPVKRKRTEYLRRALGSLTNPKRPFVSAYLGHTLDPHRLRREFPEAIFLRLRRDPLPNALSLLRCREESNTSWFSLFPKECFKVKGESVERQVVSKLKC